MCGRRDCRASAKYRDALRVLYVHDLETEPLDRLRAVVVPFQTHHGQMRRCLPRLLHFAERGGTVVVFGDGWLDDLGATWEPRPLDNSWWKRNPEDPPVRTVRAHALLQTIERRSASFHHHGVYVTTPVNAETVQVSRAGEVVSWDLRLGNGRIFASTQDPIVEHGVQQIRHLDGYVSALVSWLSGDAPTGSFELPDSHALAHLCGQLAL
ncbi:MAG: hypothetical protein HC923_06990 [Myxococcales bacterium]|nr:hypothetical protein [Myxococcales bacterium]